LETGESPRHFGCDEGDIHALGFVVKGFLGREVWSSATVMRGDQMKYEFFQIIVEILKLGLVFNVEQRAELVTVVAGLDGFPSPALCRWLNLLINSLLAWS
jgi:hypothetical protein